MIDIVRELAAMQRATGQRRVRDTDCRTVTLSRTYDADIDDVWDCLTNADRISRWFLPVKGDLTLGGSYQLEGNAGGEIRVCEPPRRLLVTWIFGVPASDTDVSEVEVRLSPAGDGRTRLELDHTATTDPDRWSEYGPGAVGVGWELALFGLAMHLESGEGRPEDPAAWAQSAEAAQYMTASSAAWGAANVAGGATPAEAAAAAENTTRFYVPQE
jgi:uncharacterized protein YndB with AHSA1/START domain